MDLLFKRYASPFSFIDGYMQSGRFDEFVVELVNTVNEEKEDATRWDFYLHKVAPEVSYQDFVAEIENNKQIQNMTEEEKAETVNEAMEILSNFNPERGE
jgi:hypothetical protein